MKILQFVNTLRRSDGGPAANAYALHRHLNMNDQVTAIMVVLKPAGWTETVAASSDTHTNGVRGGMLGRQVSGLRALRLLRTCDAVIIHGYYLTWVPVVALTAKLKRKPVFLTPHGALTSYQQQSSRAKKLIFDATAGALIQRSVTSFVVGSETEATDLHDKFPQAEVTVAGVGTEIHTPDNRQVQSGAVKEESNSEHGSVKLLSISRIAQKKRIDLMIDTVTELHRRGKKVELTVAGTGPDAVLADLRLHAKTARMSDHVHFVGEADEARKQDLYSSHDLFICPSDDENFGISTAEALANGLSCISSEYVASATSLTLPAGIILKDRAATTIADAVQEAMQFPRSTREESARSFARARYSWSAAAGRWIDAIHERTRSQV